MCYIIEKNNMYLNNFARAGWASRRNGSYYNHQNYTDDINRAIRFSDLHDAETVKNKCGKKAKLKEIESED